jgi:hypothetical protein
MKRLLGLALAVASIGVVGLGAEARAVESSTNSVTVTSGAQWQRDRYGRSYNRRRTVRRTRVVRLGRRLYRETYVVRYLPNGRIVDARLISRVRIS